MIVSLVIHAVYSSLFTYQLVRDRQLADQTGQALTFFSLLENELALYQVKAVQPKAILMSDGLSNYQVILNNQKIYKTPGHHPYAMGVKDWQLQAGDAWIQVTLIFETGSIYTGVVSYEKAEGASPTNGDGDDGT